MKPILLVDLDQVCADSLGKLCQVINAEHGLSIAPNDLTSWYLPECLPQTVNPYQYFDRPGFFRDVQPVAGAVEALQTLMQINEVVICTVATWASFGDKRAWIENHLPFVPWHNFIATSRKDLIRADIRIDDNPQYLVGGGMRMLFDAPHNRNAQVQAIRVYDWQQAYTNIVTFTRMWTRF